MGKTQEVNGAVAFNPRLLDDDREGNQPLHITSTQMHSKLKRQRATKTVRSYIQYSKEPAAAGIHYTLTHWLGIFFKGRISRDWLTYVRHNEAY
jgi:hypothetical protein